MKNMPPLIIDKRDKVKGLHTFCAKCKSITTTRICGKTGKRIGSCKFTDHHKFKIIKEIPGAQGRKKRTKVINTRDIHVALEEKINFEKELIANHYQPNTILEDAPRQKPRLLIECMAIYLAYLNNQGLEAHMKKNRTLGHVNDIERSFRYFCKSLVKQNINHTIFPIQKLNDKVVGIFHGYLTEERGFANATYNKHIATMRQFIAWLIQHKGYEVNNPFVSVRRKSQHYSNTIIEKDEFQKLLAAIKPENGLHVLKSGERKNFYKNWMKNAFIIALETGLRREEFVKLKFENIIRDKDGNYQFIRVENYKVNRSKDIKEIESKQFKVIPITPQLMILLKELEKDQSLNPQDYILAPEESLSRRTIMDRVSKAFSHFWKQTGVQKEAQLKNLRKTYLTALANHFGDKANLISDHANMNVLKKHYLNNQKLVEKATGFSIFKA